MIDPIFGLGVFGGVVLTLGALWPDRSDRHPTHSTKNWLLAAGGILLFTFALLDYLFATGPLFFVLLEALVVIASVLMMLGTSDKIDAIVIGTSGLGLVAWSLLIFEDFSTIFFVLGLIGIGLGYALEPGTARRNLVLTLGSILIVIFSYLGRSWIFFWLNVFFAIFSAYHTVTLTKKR